MIPDYINVVRATQERSITKEEFPELKNKINGCAERILSHGIDKITRSEVESFITEIYILESNIGNAKTAIPIFEEELDCLNSNPSYSGNSLEYFNSIKDIEAEKKLVGN